MKRIVLFLALAFTSVQLNAVDIIIWAEDSNSITLDRYTVQKIFTKKISRWPNGKNINVFIKPLSSIEHRDFVTKVLGLTPYYYQEQVEEQTFSGKAASITEVQNDEQMVSKIEHTPGGIGYLNYKIFKGNKEIIVIDFDVVALK